MATTIRDLLVRLGVDAEGADKDVQNLENALGDLKQMGVAVVAVLGAATAAIAGLAITAAAAGDEAAKGAARTGIAVEAYQELAFAASQSGVEITQMEQALAKQVKALLDLEKAQGPAFDGYERLGLTAEHFAGLSTDQALMLTAEALSNVAVEQERVQIAQQLFGEELGGRLLPLLNNGAAGLQDMADLANELGMVLSEESTEAAEEFTDMLDQTLGMLGGIKNAIGVGILPVLTDLMVRMLDWATANRAVIATRLEQAIELLTDGIETLVGFVELIDELVVSTFGSWEPILKAAAVVVGVIATALIGLAALKVWAFLSTTLAFLGSATAATFGVLLAKVAAVVAILIALGLVVEDVIVFLRGGDSALGRFLDRFRESEGFLGALARRIEAFIPMMQRVIEVVKQLGLIWWEVFSRTALPVLKLLWAALVAVAEGGLGLLAAFWDGVLGPAMDAMIAALDWLLVKLQALQPVFDSVLGVMDGVLGTIGDITGVDLGGGGGGGEATPAAAGAGGGVAGALESVGFAPTAGGGGAAGAAGAAETTQNTTVQGNQFTISGVGLTADEVQALIDQNEAERARQTANALAGAEV